MGRTWAFFYLAEAYMNFGLFGIIMVPAAVGCCLRLFNEWRRTRSRNYLVAVIYAVMAGNIVYFSRLDLGGQIKGIVYPFVFLFILYGVSQALVKRRSSPAHGRIGQGASTQ